MQNNRNRTLVILKPEVIERNIIGKVLQYFDSEGLKPVAMIQRRGSEHLFRLHYKDVIARVGAEIGDDIIARMTRGDCIFIVYTVNSLESALIKDAVSAARSIVGATDPKSAAAGTIRHDLGTAVQYNVVHASDSTESAEYEIRLWFPELGYHSPTELGDLSQFNLYYSGC